MKSKLLISLLFFSAFFTSCKYNDVFINPYDQNADTTEIQKICDRSEAECGYISGEYRNSIIELFCGECSDGYECKYNHCQDIDECSDLRLNNCPVHSDCHNLDMKSDGQPYECICNKNYSGDDCVPDTRLKDCENLPDGAMWNTVSRIQQTWSGSEWLPSNKGTFNETPSSTECRYWCKQNYTWTGSACKADTKTANCTGLPQNAEWNTASSIEQTWNGEEWTPSTKGTYNENKSSKECRFKCKTNFEWNGSECVGAKQKAECSELPENAIWNAVSEITQTWNGTEWLPATVGEYSEEASETECRFKCAENYDWNGSECEASTTESTCTGQPANASWNTASSITQTWSGTEWLPTTVGEYNEEASTTECRFVCNEHYNWNDSTNKCDAATQNSVCTGLPANAQWNTASSITQTWSGTEWLPTTTGSFSETASTVQCVFKCKTNYNWNDSTNKCDAATQEANCSSKPANTVWNDNGKNGKFTQTWNGSKWDPASYTSSYSTTAGVCKYKCDSTHTWENSSCINQRTASCSSKPANSTWNDGGANGKFTQTWSSSGGWSPSSYTSTYNTTAGTCRFTCNTNYNYNSSTKKCDAATQEANCSAKPENSVWNNSGTEGKFIQTWNGASWTPASYTSTYSTTSGTCTFTCASDYHWENSQCVSNSRSDVACTGKPANASWNTVDSIDQTWNGSGWQPSSVAQYNEEASETECRFGCNFNYNWNSSNKTCDAATQKWDCSAKPEHSVWNDSGENGKFIQTWNGASWDPASYTSEYSETAGVCIFKCDDTHYWYDSKCTSSCDYGPCEEVANSTHVCEATSWNDYTCECNDGYFWNGSECKKQITLGNICTGQNRCYNESEEISCPTSSTADFYGQDAQYAKAGFCYPQSFSIETNVSGENTVFDNNTGLEWQQVVSEETFTWDDASTYCNNLIYSGKDDWRLPNPQELSTIIDFGQYAPAVNGTLFPDLLHTTNNEFLWSSQTYQDYACVMGPFYAELHCNDKEKTSELNAICVRGNEFPASSLVAIDGDEIIYDEITSLIWQVSYAENMNWTDALSYCENLEYAGFTDWRLPNKNELASLINYEKTNPASDFPNTPSDWFTSSSSRPHATKTALLVSFDSGTLQDNYPDNAGKDHENLVRCVRSEKINDPCENNNSCSSVDHSTGICIQQNAFEYSCGCESGYFWDGEKCIDPCSPNPCSNLANSNKTCTALSWKDYSCGCNSGYGWNGEKCIVPLTLGNICTGQTKCYNNEGEIACPTSSTADFYGQDAQYQNKCTPQSFMNITAFDQEIVLDKNTTLQWQRRISGTTYVWEDAISYCENLEYGGYTDWRLPNPQELLTIVDNDKHHPPTNTTYFSFSNDLWTSKNYSTNNAFYLSFGAGDIWYNKSKTAKIRLMCVRGNEFKNPTFTTSTTNNNVVVKDSVTGLMWQKTYPDDKKTWQQALKYCEDLTYAGKSDWRLPNKNEVASLLNFDKSGSHSDFPDMPATWFWTSSSKSAVSAWHTNFSAFGINSETKTKSATVRCVR